MIRVFFSDSIQKEYPNAAKMIESCKKERPTEILGILEALIAQTGLNPEDPLSLGYLRRGFAMGRLAVGGCDNSGNSGLTVREDKAVDMPEEIIDDVDPLGDVFDTILPYGSR